MFKVSIIFFNQFFKERIFNKHSSRNSITEIWVLGVFSRACTCRITFFIYRWTHHVSSRSIIANYIVRPHVLIKIVNSTTSYITRFSPNNLSIVSNNSSILCRIKGINVIRIKIFNFIKPCLNRSSSIKRHSFWIPVLEYIFTNIGSVGNSSVWIVSGRLSVSVILR